MKTDRIPAALGKKRADLVLKDAWVVDVFCRRVIHCDVAVSQGVIVGLGEYRGEEEVDCRGKYVMPSFVESHVHIESSMLCPGEYAKIAAAHGVTAIVADPHEIANVCGEEGLRFMLENAKGLPVDIHYMLPSCVPATPFDHSGAILNGDATERLFQKYPFLGLGEMMNVPGVLAQEADVMKKLACAQFIDGHAPGLEANSLNAYCCAGVRTDHECLTAKELTEKVSRGMYVQLREGSQSRNIEALASGVTPYTLRRLLLCTDDRYLGDIVERGSISNCIRRAAQCGIEPIDAILMATLNACECYGFRGKGAVAPGYDADLVVSADLTAEHIEAVYKGGVKIAQQGEALFSVPSPVGLEKVTGTVHLPPVSAADFEHPFDSSQPVIAVHPHSLVTTGERRENARGLNLCAVLERHHGTGNIGLAYAAGFDLKGGAIAQSIGHDSHNITVVGDGAGDMALAVNALGKQGGMSVVRQGRVLAVCPLEVAGLMSSKSASHVLGEHMALLKAAEALGMNPELEPFMMLSFLSLLVIPHLKLSDSGLFDVDSFSFLSHVPPAEPEA